MITKVTKDDLTKLDHRRCKRVAEIVAKETDNVQLKYFLSGRMSLYKQTLYAICMLFICAEAHVEDKPAKGESAKSANRNITEIKASWKSFKADQNILLNRLSDDFCIEDEFPAPSGWDIDIDQICKCITDLQGALNLFIVGQRNPDLYRECVSILFELASTIYDFNPNDPQFAHDNSSIKVVLDIIDQKLNPGFLQVIYNLFSYTVSIFSV